MARLEWFSRFIPWRGEKPGETNAERHPKVRGIRHRCRHGVRDLKHRETMSQV